MAIALEFIDLIVPRHLIEEKHPGGWEQCLRRHESMLGETVWFDDHLLRTGAMNGRDIEAMVGQWAAMGFEPTEEIDGERVWKDVCVVVSMIGGSPTLPCEWLAFTENRYAAYLRGTSPGEVVGAYRRG